MAMLIGVTGTPASGKSTFARELSKRTGFECIEINSVLQSSRSLYDSAPNGEKVARLKPLGRRLRLMTKGKDAVIVGHLAQELDLPYGMIIVVRAEIGALYTRMRARHYDREKINDNLVCEATDYCGSVAGRVCGNVAEVGTEAEKRAAISAIAAGRAVPAKLRLQKDRMQEFAAFIRAHKKLGL